MPQELESPRTPDDLYLARGDDVCDARPVLTGDVLDDVEVTRVACLSTFGINLMLQRQVHRTSRVVVPTLQFLAAGRPRSAGSRGRASSGPGAAGRLRNAPEPRRVARHPGPHHPGPHRPCRLGRSAR